MEPPRGWAMARVRVRFQEVSGEGGLGGSVKEVSGDEPPIIQWSPRRNELMTFVRVQVGTRL